MIDGLTAEQSHFIETFILVPKVVGRKKAKTRREDAIKDFRRFNVNRAAVEARIGMIEDGRVRQSLMAEVAHAEQVIEANPKKLDFDGGHALLVKVNETARLRLQQAEAQKAYDAISARMAELDKNRARNMRKGYDRGLDVQDDIDLVWGYVQDKFEGGMVHDNASDLDSSVKAMARLDALIDGARKVKPFEMRSEALEDAVANAREDLRDDIQNARRDLTEVSNGLAQLKDRTNRAFTVKAVPADIEALITAVDAALDTAASAEPAQLPPRAVNAKSAYAAATAAVDARIPEKTAWDALHQVFQRVWEMITDHPQKDEAVYVKPRFDPLKLAYEAAKAKADAGNFAAAAADLTPLPGQATALLNLADDYAHYSEVEAERQALLDALPPAGNYNGVPQIKTVIEAALQLMVDAKAARDAGNMGEAVKKLDKIPEKTAEYDRLQIHLETYNEGWDSVEKRLNKLNGLDASVTNKLADEIKLMVDTRNAAEVLVGNGNLSGAAHKLASISGFAALLKKKAATIGEFETEKALFDARKEETRLREGDEGRVAIDDYYQRLLQDDARITNHTTGPKKDYALALEAATALKSVHGDKMALADKAKDYLASRKKLTDEIARLEGGAPGGAQAATSIATTRSKLVEAERMAGGGNWQGAAWLLEDAELELEQGTRAAEIAEDIDGLQDPLNLDGIAANFDAALGEFTKVETHVSGLDTDGIFTARLRAARQTAESGRSSMPGDPATARAKIEQGIAACKEIGKRITQYELYQNKLTAAKQGVDDAKSWNKDKCIDQEIDGAKDRIKQAERQVKAPALDFEAAINSLSEASNLITKGIVAGEVYDDPCRSAEKAMKDCIKALEKKDVATGVATETARMQRILSDMTTAFDNRELATAKAKAREGVDLIPQYLSLVDNYKKATRDYKKLVADTGAKTLDHPAIPDLIARIRAVIQGIDDMMAAHAYHSAWFQTYQVAAPLAKARKAIADFPAWEKALDATDTALRDLEARDDAALGPAHDAILALRERFNKAREEARIYNFATATRQLTGFVADCDKVEADVDLYDRYLSVRDAAIGAITRLSSSDTSAIAPLFRRLEGKRDNALGRAAAFDFTAAIDLFTELQSDCATAAAALDGASAFGRVMDKIKEVDDGDSDDLRASIRAAEATFKQLRGKPSAMYTMPRLKGVEDLLRDASVKVDDDFAAAKALVVQALDECRAISIEMGQFDQLCDAADQARKLGAALVGHPQYRIEKDAIDTALAQVDQAMNGVRMRNDPRAGATQAIEAAIAEFRRLRAVLDDHAAYVAERDQIRFELNSKLEKNKDRPLAKEDIAKAQEALAEAETKADARDYKTAAAELKKARDRIAAGLFRIKTGKNEVPSEQDIKAMLASKDGTKLMDEVINALEPKIQRKVIAEVFKARFGCDLVMTNVRRVNKGGKDVDEATPDTDMNRAAPNLRKFYKLMSDLPPEDTLDNDSMLIFEHQGGYQTGSYFGSDEKRVAMHEGEDKTSGIYGISQETELGPQDDAVKCEDGEPVSFFSWNTLHEVAHAVDDRISFMSRHDGEGNDTYGGWVDYGSNVLPIARAIAGEYNFDAAYVAQYMTGGEKSAPPVPEPVGCDADEWNRRRRDCEIWVNRARVGNNPWQTKISADACTIGGRVYHEAYKNGWVSYMASARGRGVSGYQFRAPGEWFAELYAAFHTGKLKNSHPDYGWLEDL